MRLNCSHRTALHVWLRADLRCLLWHIFGTLPRLPGASANLTRDIFWKINS